MDQGRWEQFSVMNKTLPSPSGDQHDYVSIAIYEWPCHATPPGRVIPLLLPGLLMHVFSNGWAGAFRLQGLPWQRVAAVR
jgi:hypothetical protein